MLSEVCVLLAELSLLTVLDQLFGRLFESMPIPSPPISDGASHVREWPSLSSQRDLKQTNTTPHENYSSRDDDGSETYSWVDFAELKFTAFCIYKSLKMITE